MVGRSDVNCNVDEHTKFRGSLARRDAEPPPCLSALAGPDAYDRASRMSTIDPKTRARAALGRLRRALRPVGAADSWPAFQASVEPALAAVPRVHRFAQPPLLGEPALRPVPLALWGAGDGAADATTAPAATLAGADPFAAAAESRAEWVVLAREHDRLAPLALERLGQAVALAPDADVVTCDDDLLGADGGRLQPHVRPGPSPDRWLALDDSGPLLCVRREALLAQRGALAETVGGPGWRHELALRLAGAAGERHAHVPMLLCHRGRPAGAPLAAARVAQLLAERGEHGVRVEQLDGGVRRVRRPVAGEPSVEAIVPFRDKPELLRRCVRTLLERSTYERLSVQLVDNGSQEPATAELLRELGRDPRVTVVRDEQPFNYAAINNAAVARSTADVVVFLNNDTAVETPDWVELLLEETQRPQVGAVAPLLTYPDGTVQHAGAALGIHGYAGHPFAGLAPGATTPFGRADAGTRNWLAVTAACMMVERAKLDAVGRFDEGFVVAGNDVDLCLRLTAAGHRSLCLPHVRLLHDESRSRGGYVDPGDFAASERSYGLFRTVGDPFYNPNLTLSRSDCGMRAPEEAIS